MKLLYLDFLNPKGHLRLDFNQINALANIAKVTVVSPLGRYKSLPESVELIEKKSLIIKKGKWASRITSLKSMLISAIVSRKIDHDCILVSSFETIMFALGKGFFKNNKRIILIHHFNTDELANSIKAFFFRRYMNHVEHIVFEDFIKERLVNDFDIASEKVHVLPHHLTQLATLKENKNTYDCVGLSNSNDEKIIAKIIEKEKEKSIFKKSGCNVVLKSKNYEYDNGNLKVIKGFLEKSKYEEYINNSRSVYMPFPSNFKYRMSGTLIDAFSNNKVVYGSNILVMQNFSKRYPEICKIVNTVDDFFDLITNDRFRSNYEPIKVFTHFKNDYSTESIEKKFSEILSN
jgi:hypothetical protein